MDIDNSEEPRKYRFKGIEPLPRTPQEMAAIQAWLDETPEIEFLRKSNENLQRDRDLMRAGLKSAQQQIDQWRQLYEESEARLVSLLNEGIATRVD